MTSDPDATADMNKLVVHHKSGSSGFSGLTDLVTQAKDSTIVAPPQPRRSFNTFMRFICECFLRRNTRVYDMGPPTAVGLLPPQAAKCMGKKTLVLDLDETLVHSSFEPMDDANLTAKVTIEGGTFNVYIKTRPGLKEFLEETAELYELVVFTASLAKYADPVLDKIDPKALFSHRLFREHCVLHKGTYVKDLSRLGRDLNNVVILDDNAIPIKSFFNDSQDHELSDLLSFLREMSQAEDVPGFLTPYRRNLSEKATADYTQFAERQDCNSPRNP